jgi:hypothetical protein
MSESTETETGKEIPDSKPIAAGLAFSGLVQIRNTEATLRWQGFQFAVGLNIAGWGAVGVWLLNNPTLPVLQVMFVVCFGALAGNRVYFSVLARDGKFMGLWNAKSIELEQANAIEGGVKIFSSPEYLDLKSRAPTIQQVLRRTIIFASVVWGLGVIGIALVLIRSVQCQCL